MKLTERLNALDTAPAPTLPVTFMASLEAEAWCDFMRDVADGEQMAWEDYWHEWCDARHETELMENAPPCECEAIDWSGIPY